MVVNVIMKRYFTGAIKYGLFFFFLLSSAHSFAQETGGEQVLQFECTAINIGTLSEDDAPVSKTEDFTPYRGQNPDNYIVASCNPGSY